MALGTWVCQRSTLSVGVDPSLRTMRKENGCTIYISLGVENRVCLVVNHMDALVIADLTNDQASSDVCPD
jgi:hypothetical protein